MSDKELVSTRYTGDKAQRFIFDNCVATVHSAKVCDTAYACTIHRPSIHWMNEWAMVLRESGIIERRCEHGVGHPDPDSAAYMRRESGDDYYGTHGCDGCCFDTQEG